MVAFLFRHNCDFTQGDGESEKTDSVWQTTRKQTVQRSNQTNTKMRYKKIFIVQIFCLILICNNNAPVAGREMQKRGVMDNLNDGLKIAGQMFGINTAADVANLVAKAFSSTRNKNQPDLMSIFQQRKQEANSAEQQEQQQYAEEQQQQQTQQYESNESARQTATPAKEEVNVDFSAAKLVTSVLRMIGFDASKLGALAINALIMVAQAIGNTLMSTTKTQRVVSSTEGGRFFPYKHDDDEPEAVRGQHEHQPRALRDDTPIDWFLEQPSKQMRQLLDEVMDTQLSDKLTHMIEKLEAEEGQAACLKMLMCKSSPFIWGMQKSLSKRLSGKKEPVTVTQADAEKLENTHKLLSTEGFFTHLPSVAEYREHGAQCEQRYAAQCNTTQAFETYKREKRVK